jgi:autotransporter translocation and assembly factor TamB
MARNWKRAARWLLAALAVKLALLAAAGWWLLTTEAGLARAVGWLESLDNVKIRVHGVRGRLIGPLHVDAIDI